MNQTKKVNLNDLIYRYKGNTPNEEFNKYDNALDLIDKIRNYEIKLAEVKNNQNNFKLTLGEIKRSKKTQYTILKCFIKRGKRLLSFLMIIL